MEALGLGKGQTSSKTYTMNNTRFSKKKTETKIILPFSKKQNPFSKKKKKKKHHSTKTNMDWKVSFTQENQPMRKYQQDLYVFS